MGYCDVLSRTPGRVQVHNKRWQVAFLGSNQRAELCKKERCSRETWSLALMPSAGSGRLGAVAADRQEGGLGHSLWLDMRVSVTYGAGRGIPPALLFLRSIPKC